MHTPEQLHSFLDEQADRFNRPDFIADDPISIPHLFSKKEDVEIAGFLTATIAWGQRPVILKNALQLVERMDMAPGSFIREHSVQERKRFNSFVHRTFNGIDLCYFIKALQQLYNNEQGLEGCFGSSFQEYDSDMGATISDVKRKFMRFRPQIRTGKHFADPLRNSSAKRINMFLRWMVRKDNRGVDFGIWNSIPASALHIPLDLHSGTVARELGLLNRKQDDWKAVTELTHRLRTLDASDPVRYDFALYGTGVFNRYNRINKV
ncbi:MAG: TIGR02757 family protein [Bacteroidota bacterium]